LLARVSVPLCDPAAVGANCTDTLKEAPAPTVADVALGVNRGLLMEMELTFKVAVPTLLMVSVIERGLPTVTEPKASVAGETAMDGAAADVPVPDTPTVNCGLAGSVLAMVKFPDCEPDAVGANRSVTAVEPPVCTVKGVAGLVAANMGLELEIKFTVKAAVPVLEIASDRLELWPTVTFPKVSEEGVTPIFGAAVPALPAT
jgi:hypothetical protein